MAQSIRAANPTAAHGEGVEYDHRGSSTAYTKWLLSQDVPIHGGYYVQDARQLERAFWDLRGCPAAIVNLEGHKSVEQIYVLEVPPGESIPPFHIALEELIYVLDGQGIATVWAEGHPKVSFEFQKHSYFRIPTNHHYQLSNTRGDQPVLTLHVNLMPLALHSNRNTDYIFNNPLINPTELYKEEDGKGFYSAEARAVAQGDRVRWYSNFFPDLTIFDKLDADTTPGRLSYHAGIWFPDCAFSTELMVLPSQRFRNAHRHAAGTTIVGIQEAQGVVVMWPEGGEPVVAPWQEGAIFVPPYHWYHLHMNTGAVENRQLRIRAPRPGANPDADPQRMLPLTALDPSIRQIFEGELAKNGLTSLMPEEAYTNPNYEWDPAWLKQD
ncbi:MAG: cupin domain-containing protein [Chloroflexi bacterium]|nr:cupin domain-containing protein [Chloroflexota bacterium]